MPHRPVGIVAERVHRPDGEEGALEGREAVEDRGHEHEAQRRVVAHLVPGAVERGDGVPRRRPGGHEQHDREGHAEGLHPVGQRGVVQVVRSGPDVEEDDAPEAEDGEPVGPDRPAGAHRQEVVEHAEEARRQEEGDGVVAVPPLDHGVLDPGPDREAVGHGEADRQRQVVDDVQHRDDEDEGHVVPVGDVDVRLVPAREGADVEREVGEPDDDQPEVGVPFGLGVFLRLGAADQVAGRGPDAEEVVADQDHPGADRVGEPRPGGALHDVEGGGDERVAGEAEDDAGGVDGPQASEARPRHRRASRSASRGAPPPTRRRPWRSPPRSGSSRCRSASARRSSGRDGPGRARGRRGRRRGRSPARGRAPRRSRRATPWRPAGRPRPSAGRGAPAGTARTRPARRSERVRVRIISGASFSGVQAAALSGRAMSARVERSRSARNAASAERGGGASGGSGRR